MKLNSVCKVLNYFAINNTISSFKVYNAFFVTPFSFFLLVLSRVKDFLPKMKEAEEMLEKEIAEKSTSGLDIENIADGAPYIEMVRTVTVWYVCKCCGQFFFPVKF